MDPRSALMLFRVEHSHGDGTWGTMVEDRSHHDAADHDPERGWGQRRVFRCDACDESVSIVTDGPAPAPTDH